MIPNFGSLLAQVVDLPEAEKHHGTTYFFPEEASAFAANVDWFYMAIYWISLFFFVIIVGLMCYFVVKYRRQPGVRPLPSPSHNTTIEILWSVLPSIILVWIFYEGAKGFFEMRIIPDDAEEIQVTANSFNWKFTYPNGDTTNSLHLVKDRPVKLLLQSEDVLHCFFVPAFRQKMDVVPGRFTTAYIVPTMAGRYRATCAEYCGEGHSIMRTFCEVHVSEADRIKKTEWKTADHLPAINGQHLYQIHCAGCHAVDGKKSTGPALNLIWGTNEKFTNADPQQVDAEYIRESLRDPNKKIVAGYEPKMPVFDKSKLSDKDILNIVAFIELKDNMKDLTEDKLKEILKAKSPTDENPAPSTNEPKSDGGAEKK